MPQGLPYDDSMTPDMYGNAALRGLGIAGLSTGIPRTSRIPIQRRAGSPTMEEDDIDGYLEVQDQGIFDDMLLGEEEDEDAYGAYPRILKSRFIESFLPTSAQGMTGGAAQPQIDQMSRMRGAMSGLGMMR